MMQLFDVLAAVLVAVAAGTFTFGAIALSRTSDAEAVVYLVVGGVSLRAAVELVRPGASA